MQFRSVALAVTLFMRFDGTPHSSPPRAEAVRCTLSPGGTFALVRVEQDTTLAFDATGAQPMSYSSIPTGPGDSLLATLATPMPAARVRLMELDSATRVVLTGHGVTDSQPVAFIRAAPFRADCRTIRWTDTTPFVERGEVGFVRATLAPRERWIDGVPVLVIPDVWNYPYPRRRGVAFMAAPEAPLTPARAMFSFSEAIDVNRETVVDTDSAQRIRATAWARRNPADAELEPVRWMLRQLVLDPHWLNASRVPSRLRGTYRVELEVRGARSTWFFRTHDLPGYPWRGADSNQTTAAMLASPHILGYRLVGYAAGSRDSLVRESPRGALHVPLVWLATSDRPTTPGNDARRTLSSILEFNLSAVSERFWSDLEAFVPRLSPMDSARVARFKPPRGSQQPQLPLTIRLNERGAVRADTTLAMDGRTIRVMLARVDTLSVRRPW